MTRLLIVGLDGLNWPLLERLFEVGAMPHLARLRHEGAWGPLTSVVPTQSASAWASFITGQNPARHGVLDFMARQPDGSYRHAKPHPATTLWQYLGQAGYRVGVVNFPVTYPPDPVNGFLVSGMLALPGRTFTHPPALGNELLSVVPGYRLDLEWQLYDRREMALIGDLTDMIQRRSEAIHYLNERYAPDCLAVAFIGPDRLQHALWRHLDPGHPHHDPTQAVALASRIHGFYRTLDEAVGQLVDSAGDRATVLILSDHGFQATAWQFHVNGWLAERGWLAQQQGRRRIDKWIRRLDTPWVQHVRRRLIKDVSRHLPALQPGGTIDWSRTIAFNPWNEHQGVRLNVQGREPQGIVAPGADYERRREEIYYALLATTEPQTGQPVIERLWRREEIYSGPLLDEMPDLVFTLHANLGAIPVQQQLWAATGWASGDHSLEGMFLAWGQGIAPGYLAGGHLVDVAPTALYLAGQPIPSIMDGQVLTAALNPELVAAHPVRIQEIEPPPLALPLDGEAMTAQEELDVQERLRGLGYL